MIRLDISTIAIGDIGAAVTALIASIALVVAYKRYSTFIRECLFNAGVSMVSWDIDGIYEQARLLRRQVARNISTAFVLITFITHFGMLF